MIRDSNACMERHWSRSFQHEAVACRIARGLGSLPDAHVQPTWIMAFDVLMARNTSWRGEYTLGTRGVARLEPCTGRIIVAGKTENRTNWVPEISEGCEKAVL